MPWKESSKMSLREAFAAAALSGEESFAAVCRRYGISRKTGYKWMERVRAGEPLDKTEFHMGHILSKRLCRTAAARNKNKDSFRL